MYIHTNMINSKVTLWSLTPSRLYRSTALKVIWHGHILILDEGYKILFTAIIDKANASGAFS